ncbi:lysophospholipid acyltransferase family protein [Synechococcus sp. BDU 130192]|uniref:lysophospholipid acyltransferase family protein n=1 Tax=Synechococcus sp. BDU 130192 TaxID=2042059 RepID=UPI000C08C42C|nr:lysophospholipid acyltransferase family protein [Synechococcus sp. BDU 130192]
MPLFPPFPPLDPPLDGWSLEGRDPETIRRLLPLWEWLYKFYFRVETSGWENLPTAEPVLGVGSHNGGLAAPDMWMMMYDWFQRYGVERPTYGLMHRNIWLAFPELAKIAVKTGAVQAHPKMAIAALKSGANVLVYPGGGQDVFRPHAQRNQIYFAERRGFIKLALRQGVPIVPLISWGAHDSIFVIEDIYEPLKEFLKAFNLPWLFNIDPEVFPIYLGLPWGVAFGPLPNFPLPTKMYTRVCPPIRFEKYGRAAAGDRPYVEACYQRVLGEMQRELDQLIAEVESRPKSCP